MEYLRVGSQSIKILPWPLWQADLLWSTATLRHVPPDVLRRHLDRTGPTTVKQVSKCPSTTNIDCILHSLAVDAVLAVDDEPLAVCMFLATRVRNVNVLVHSRRARLVEQASIRPCILLGMPRVVSVLDH